MISQNDIYVSYIKETEMARMTRTIISIPEDEKKWLETYGKRQRISSAEVIRRAIREYRQLKAEKSLAGVLRETAGSCGSIEGDSWEHVDSKRAEWERVAGTGAGVKSAREDRSAYGSPCPADPTDMTDIAERRQRAIAAAGRFESGVPDLSIEHDRYLGDAPAEDGVANGRPAQGGAKKDGGSR
jgi:hypothetical protein